MKEHFGTQPEFLQTREEVLNGSEEDLIALMEMCGVDPGEPEECLACYAYEVYCVREANKREEQSASLPIREKLHGLFVGWAIETTENQGLHGWRCRYPERYGPCRHYEEFLNEVVDLIKKDEEVLLAELAQYKEAYRQWKTNLRSFDELTRLVQERTRERDEARRAFRNITGNELEDVDV